MQKQVELLQLFLKNRPEQLITQIWTREICSVLEKVLSLENI